MTAAPSAARRLGRLVLTELRLYAAIVPWLLRRRDVPAGGQAWPYAALVAPVLWLWIFASATEVVVLHLIIPWETVRLVVDVISVWGLVWMVGLLAAYRVKPHVLLPDRLLVRNGVQHDIAVQTADVVAAVAREVELPSAMRSLHVMADGDAQHVSVGVSGRTNVVLTLRPGTPLRTANGIVQASSLGLWVDEPRQLTAQLKQRIASAAQGPSGTPAAPPSR
jgi:uncharacterized membrane protein YkvA (DUF1232 family)